MMKRIALLLLVASTTWILPAFSQSENRAIGENRIEAKKAAKQQRKTVNRNAKRQRKAAKRYQKAESKAAKQQQHRKQ